MSEGRADLGGGALQPSTFQLKVSGENQTTTSAAEREGERRGDQNKPTEGEDRERTARS